MAALWQSCLSEDLQGAKTELERAGADVNFRRQGSTCLMVAVVTENEELVALLLGQQGLEVNAVTDDVGPTGNQKGSTALHIAGQFSSPSIIRMLLDWPGTDKEAKDFYGRSPLISSIFNGGEIAQVEEFFRTPGMRLREGDMNELAKAKPEELAKANPEVIDMILARAQRENEESMMRERKREEERKRLEKENQEKENKEQENKENK